MEKKVKAPQSRKGGKQACLCEDGTYKKECCNGSTIAQGIFSISDLTNATINHTIQEKVYVNGNEI